MFLTSSRTWRPRTGAHANCSNAWPSSRATRRIWSLADAVKIGVSRSRTRLPVSSPKERRSWPRKRLAFVRSTLPPAAQAACSSAAPPHCPNPANVPSAELEAELAKDTASYDATRALSLFAAIHQAKADCFAPELACLNALLPQYGGTPASAKLLEQNLSLIGKQQPARAGLDPEAAEQCISQAVIQYRDRIVNAYGAYVREPAALPFALVQKTFLGLHEEQLKCLLRVKKASKH